MPKPVYIICSESGAEDRNTGIASHFNVIEKIQVRRVSEQVTHAPPLTQTYFPAHVTAVWMQEPDDFPETPFEFEIRVCLPPQETWVLATGATFSFSKPLHRLTVTLYLPPLQGAGTMWVECRVRRPGADEWISQRYPILVEDITPATEGSSLQQGGEV